MSFVATRQLSVLDDRRQKKVTVVSVRVVLVVRSGFSPIVSNVLILIILPVLDLVSSGAKCSLLNYC